MGLTREQELVRDTRDKNILVSAAAGSGKTFVLVERIISEILDEKNGIDVDEILVVTFTKAAAAEMKDRIRQAIDKAILERGADARVRMQATLIHGAHIRTIDSFCSWVVKNYFYAIDMDPTFRIATTGEMKLLEDEAFKDLLSEYLESNDENFNLLADAYIDRNRTAPLKDMVMGLHEKATSFPWVDEWYDEAIRIYDIDSLDELENSDFIKEIKNRTDEILKEYPHKIQQVIDLYEDQNCPYCTNVFKPELAQIIGILQADSFKDKYMAFSNCQFANYPRNKTTLSADDAARAKALRDEYKDEINKLKAAFYGESAEDLLSTLLFVKKQAVALISFAKDFTNRLLAEKTKKSIYTFNDIEHMALEILRNKASKGHEPTAVASELANHFKEIMVDEYQDSNELQEQILTAISLGRNYFTVGDVKQSIYAFRQASPQLFIDKLNSYPSVSNETPFLRIDLDNNFRSRKEVLDFCNEVFKPLMQMDMGGVEYDEKAALKAGDTTFKGDTKDYQSEVIIATQSSEDMAELDIDNKDALEALVVAKRIKELMAEGFKVSYKEDGIRQLRDMKYSDVVILMAGVSNHASSYIKTLTESGIPAYVAEEKGFFEREEIETVLAMLEVIDNPYNDIPLAAVLHSGMFGFTTNRLAQIKAGADSDCLYQTLLDYMENHKAKDIRYFIDTLNLFRDKAVDTPIHELLEEILEHTGYGIYVSALPTGKMGAANLDKLIDEAVNFESTSFKGFSRFVAYIQSLKTYDEDLGIAKTVGENDNAVRIMTIHKSKGLEFPIVFVCGCGAPNQVNKDSYCYDDKFGLALNYRNPITKVEGDAAFYKLLKLRLQAKEKGELFRKYYVALTRPVDKLIITASIKPTSKSSVPEIIEGYSPANEVLDYFTKEKANTIIELIIRSMRTSGSAVPIRIIDCGELFVDEVKKEIVKKDTLDRINEVRSKADTVTGNLIFDKLSFQYSNIEDSKYKSKYSVSEIKHQAMEENFEDNSDAAPAFVYYEEEAYIPKFIRQLENKAQSEDSTPAGALYGTAMHRFMECFDFTVDDCIASFDEQLQQMKKLRMLSDDEQLRISPYKLKRFMGEEIALRMNKAAKNNKLYKEKPFVFGTDGKQLFSDESSSNEMILVQGIIDVFFEEDDGIVLLDYKTDRVDEADQLVLRYEKQLQLYKSAIEKAYNNTVKEVLIYSFALDETIKLD